MQRSLILVALVGVGFLTACGSASPSSTASGGTDTGGAQNSTSGSSSGQSGRGPRNASAGEVVKLSATSLILNTQAGDVTVTYDSTTSVSRTSTAALPDVTVGACVAITGPRDGTGALTVTSVRLFSTTTGNCAGFPGGPGGGGPGGTPDPNRTPDPSRSPRPGGNAQGVVGQVTSVNGTAVSIKDRTGATQTITVPTTVTITRTASAAASDLSIGDCVVATGAKDASGTVSARALLIQPAGPNGCFTGGAGGGFGFGGGNRGGGGGGGGNQSGGSRTSNA